MYNRAITKGLTIFYIIFAIAFYCTNAAVYNLPSLGEHWAMLASLIVLLVALVALTGVIVNVCLYLEIDHDTKRMNVELYNKLGDNVISSLWYWVMLICAIVSFHIQQFGNALVCFVLFSFVYTFRLVHLRMVNKAKVVDLSTEAKRK